eukprot:TRINITY_DN868_c0_g2_i1.p1 TRINITY_DN868_c0_g2~~TRINITY_DN868_c0_g2_i1.p1  ORF type:complete len:220 (+),score=7.98 TRINITY_DN868_c0_g2_i1:23-682(+)
MSFDVSNNINSAIISGTLGLQNASNGITEASLSIAQRNAQAQSPEDLLAGAATQQLGVVGQLLPDGGNSLTTDLVGLTISATNAQASAKVLDVANDTVGRIIDELAQQSLAMNIVTPIPTTVVFTTANVNTEAARRDNVQRETIPQTSGLENSAAETGLGSESDRVKTAGQQPQPVTYERPQPAQAQTTDGQGNPLDQDNGEDPSAGREKKDKQKNQPK